MALRTHPDFQHLFSEQSTAQQRGRLEAFLCTIPIDVRVPRLYSMYTAEQAAGSLVLPPAQCASASASGVQQLLDGTKDLDALLQSTGSGQPAARGSSTADQLEQSQPIPGLVSSVNASASAAAAPSQRSNSSAVASCLQWSRADEDWQRASAKLNRRAVHDHAAGSHGGSASASSPTPSHAGAPAVECNGSNAAEAVRDTSDPGTIKGSGDCEAAGRAEHHYAGAGEAPSSGHASQAGAEPELQPAQDPYGVEASGEKNSAEPSSREDSAALVPAPNQAESPEPVQTAVMESDDAGRAAAGVSQRSSQTQQPAAPDVASEEHSAEHQKDQGQSTIDLTEDSEAHLAEPHKSVTRSVVEQALLPEVRLAHCQMQS